MGTRYQRGQEEGKAKDEQEETKSMQKEVKLSELGHLSGLASLLNEGVVIEEDEDTEEDSEESKAAAKLQVYPSPSLTSLPLFFL